MTEPYRYRTGGGVNMADPTPNQSFLPRQSNAYNSKPSLSSGSEKTIIYTKKCYGNGNFISSGDVDGISSIINSHTNDYKNYSGTITVVRNSVNVTEKIIPPPPIIPDPEVDCDINFELECRPGESPDEYENRLKNAENTIKSKFNHYNSITQPVHKVEAKPKIEYIKDKQVLSISTYLSPQLNTALTSHLSTKLDFSYTIFENMDKCEPCEKKKMTIRLGTSKNCKDVLSRVKSDMSGSGIKFSGNSGFGRKLRKRSRKVSKKQTKRSKKVSRKLSKKVGKRSKRRRN